MDHMSKCQVLINVFNVHQVHIVKRPKQVDLVLESVIQDMFALEVKIHPLQVVVQSSPSLIMTQIDRVCVQRVITVKEELCSQFLALKEPTNQMQVKMNA